MILPDVNVLISAFRPDAPQHALCRPWLDAVALGEARFGISPLALAAVVRITTGPRFYDPPSTLDDAFGFCDDILTLPHCEPIAPSNRHWAIFRRLCMESSTPAPRVSDAWYAALAIEHGCTWITLDRDFARFPGLRWARPEIPV